MSLIFTAGQRPAPTPRMTPTVVDRTPHLRQQARLQHLTATRLIAALDRYLTHLDAIPLEDWARWDVGNSVYLWLRYGPLPPVTPPWWPWRHTLRGWLHQSYALAVQLRGSHDDRAALWRLCWPVTACEALDTRAHTLRVDLSTEWRTWREMADDPPQVQAQKRRRRAASAD